MTTETWQDFDPNLDIPVGLKNTLIVQKPDVENNPSMDTEFDIQEGNLDDDSEFEAEDSDNVLAAPSSFVVISQTVRVAPDGTQVVDVIIDVEEVQGALDYEARVSPVTVN